jgi:hypothetical protein
MKMQPVKAVELTPSPFQKEALIRVAQPEATADLHTGVRHVRELTQNAPRSAQLSAFEAEMLMEWSLP